MKKYLFLVSFLLIIPSISLASDPDICNEYDICIQAVDDWYVDPNSITYPLPKTDGTIKLRVEQDGGIPKIMNDTVINLNTSVLTENDLSDAIAIAYDVFAYSASLGVDRLYSLYINGTGDCSNYVLFENLELVSEGQNKYVLTEADKECLNLSGNTQFIFKVPSAGRSLYRILEIIAYEHTTRESMFMTVENVIAINNISPDSFIVTSKIDDLYFVDYSILYWFLGTKLVLYTLWLI